MKKEDTRSSLSFRSPTEEKFAHLIINYLDDGVDFQSQVEVGTICGRFSIDLVVDNKIKSIGFECDGCNHRRPRDELRDEWRDAIILGEGRVEAIYRLRGTDVIHHPEDCLLVIARWDPEIFSQEGLTRIEEQASMGARLQSLRRHNITAEINYHNHEYPKVIVKRRSYNSFPPGKADYWRQLFEYARRNPGDLNDVMERYKEEESLWKLPSWRAH